MDLWYYRLELFNKEDTENLIKFNKDVVKQINKSNLDPKNSKLDIISLFRKLFPNATEEDLNSLAKARLEDLQKLPLSIQLYIIPINNETKKTYTISKIISEGIDLFQYYLRKSDYDKIVDRPRYFTDEEISSIVKSVFYKNDENGQTVPKIRGAFLRAREYVTNKGIEWFTNELRIYQFTFKNLIKLTELAEHDLVTSIAVPGTAVGILAGEAIGSMNTQATLNTFHSSGQDTSATMNTNSYSDIIGASENPNVVNSIVIFRNRHITYEEAYKKRADIVGIKFSHILLNNMAIEKLESLGGLQWWHIFQGALENTKPNDIILRLFFDVDRLYSYDINLVMLKDKIIETLLIPLKNIVNNSIGNKGQARQSQSQEECLSQVYYSPDHEGIIDIIPNREMILSIMKEGQGNLSCDEDDDSCINIYLKIFVLDQLRNTKIKGIDGIIASTPQVDPVAQIILSEKNINDPGIIKIILDEDIEEPDHLWVIFLNKNRMKMTGIKPENLSYLMKLCNIQTLLVNKQKNYMIVLSEKKPSEIILEKVNVEKKKNKKMVKDLADLGFRGYIPIPRTELIKASEYIYLILTGEKNSWTLKDLMSKRYIDPQYTYSSNAHELTYMLGIESSYNYIYNILNTVSDAVGGANRRYIDVVTQVMTRNGRVKGLKTQTRESTPGFLSRMTFSRAGSIMASEGIVGAKEGMFAPSTAIITGQRTMLGTGYLNTEEPIDEIDAFLDNEEENDLSDDVFNITTTTGMNVTEEPEAQAAVLFKENKLLEFKALYGERPDIQVGTEKAAHLVDNIPIMQYHLAQNLNKYITGINLLLEKHSNFHFLNPNIFNEVSINLNTDKIREVLMDVVTVRDLNTDISIVAEEHIDDHDDIMGIANLFG